MADRLSDLEAAILAKLQADPVLATSVKTFEADIREAVFAGERLTKGFRGGELPAVGVSAQLSAPTSRPVAASEVEWTIPVAVACVARNRNKNAAMAAAREIQDRVAAVFNAARASAGQFAVNTCVRGDLSTPAYVIEEEPYNFGIASVEAVIIQFAPLEVS